MFSMVTKEQYFGWVRSPHPEPFERMAGDLKHIQDLAVWDLIKDSRNLAIVEAGGGASRMLESLDRSNALTNADEFLGQDGGPGAVYEIPGVTVHRGKIGAGGLPSGSTDLVYSISVIEHIPARADLKAFFDDIVRILKPNGRTVHAIDVYMHSQPGTSGVKSVDDAIAYYQGRMRMIHDVMLQAGLRFVGPVTVDLDGSAFRSEFASNSDLAMLKWDAWGGLFSELRRHSQVCSLIIDARKN